MEEEHNCHRNAVLWIVCNSRWAGSASTRSNTDGQFHVMVLYLKHWEDTIVHLVPTHVGTLGVVVGYSWVPS